MHRRRVFAAIVAATLTSCAGMAPRPLPPRVDVESVRLTASTSGDPVVAVHLGVDNPNAFPVTIQSIDAALRVEDVPVGVASLPGPVTLIASGRTGVDVEARIDIMALRSVLDRVLRNRKAAYEVAGTAVVQDGRRLDFRKRGEFSLADLLGRIR